MRLVKALCRSISGRQGSRPPEIRTHSRTAALLTRCSCSYSSFRRHQLPKDGTSPPWCLLPTPLQWKSNSSVCFRGEENMPRPSSVCPCRQRTVPEGRLSGDSGQLHSLLHGCCICAHFTGGQTQEADVAHLQSHGRETAALSHLAGILVAPVITESGLAVRDLG